MSARRLSATTRQRRPVPAASAPGWGSLRGGMLRVRGLLGRHLSVRAKLTLWYGFMCGLTLALAGGSMYFYVQHRLAAQISNDVTSTGEKVNAEIAKRLPDVPGRHFTAVPACAGTPDPVPYFCASVGGILRQQSSTIAKPGQFVQVLLSLSAQFNPALIAKSRPRAIVLSPLEYVAAIEGQTYQRTLTLDGQSYRVYFARLRLPPQLSRGPYYGVLEVFQNEGDYLQIEQIVLFTLLAAIPIGLLIALAAGWLIARAALRPINRISRTVQAIGESKDLSRRLDFIGPNDEVGRLASTFDGMMNRLERVFETQKRFVADASHELRTPLTSIRGNADLMRIAPPEDQEICLSAIRREAGRMSRLVSDLLLLAEGDAAQQEIQRRPVDLDDVVLDVYNSARIMADSRVEIVLEQLESVCVEGDADRLKQLLLNLSDNAVKFTPDGGTVSIGLWHEGGSALIAVSDSGVGIAAEDKAAIFERFYRVEQARTTRGSGLGLAICAWIVSAHGGSIDLSSELGKGSTFSVRLPALERAPAGKT